MISPALPFYPFTPSRIMRAGDSLGVTVCTSFALFFAKYNIRACRHEPRHYIADGINCDEGWHLAIYLLQGPPPIPGPCLPLTSQHSALSYFTVTPTASVAIDGSPTRLLYLSTPSLLLGTCVPAKVRHTRSLFFSDD